MKKGIMFLIAGFFLLSLLITLNLANALGTQLICLRESETIYFSECNPNINDYSCDSTTCQLCSNEISSGVYCPASLNVCNDVGGTCIYLYEESDVPLNLPVITLINPIDKYANDSEVSVMLEFSFKVTRSSELEKCELIVNGNSVKQKLKPISLTTQKLYYNVSAGYYIWKIKCTQRASYGSNVIFSDSRSFTIGNKDSGNEQNNTENTTLITTVNLTSPENEFVGTGQQDINFSFNISNITGITQCNLNLNELLIGINNISAENIITQSISAGSYTWKIDCLKGQETISSELRNLTINAVADIGGNSGGSGGGGWGGGGGGSSKTKTTNITTQNISTNQNTNKENNETANTEITNTEQNRLAGITGAVTGTIKNNKTPVAIGFVIIIAIAGIISFNYQKRKK